MIFTSLAVMVSLTAMAESRSQHSVLDDRREAADLRVEVIRHKLDSIRRF